MRPLQPLVLLKGAGDLGTGCAVRLHRAGFAVVMTELPEPKAVRRTVAFSEAVSLGRATVEGVEARPARDPLEARRFLSKGWVAVLVDPDARCRHALQPLAVVDARMAKRNLGTSRSEARVVVGLGPGFSAGQDVHAVVETNRGHRLGAVIYSGEAEPNTGIPGEIEGHTTDRLLRAPAAGRLRAVRVIGDRVAAGTVVATIGDQEVRAAIGGVLRGLLRDGALVREGEKVGDIDPRVNPEHCASLSDKALAVAGGVLEAILYLSRTVKPGSGRLRLPMTTRDKRPRLLSRRSRPRL